MPIPNSSTLIKKIQKGSEGGNEFSRIINLLLTSEFKETNIKFSPFSDSQGDYKGLDGYTKTKTYITGYQYKFYSSPLSSKHKSLIKKSLKNALDKSQELSSWILITPEDFMKNDVEWFAQLKQEYEFSYSLDEMVDYSLKHGRFPERNMLELEHWGHTKILEMMLKHPHIGEKYYPELFSNISKNIKKQQKPKLIKLGIDNENCNWSRFKNDNLSFYQFILDEKKHRTTDIIFDCFFINNSKTIYLLHSIDIEIIELWSSLKGIRSDQLLQSIGLLEVNIDFEKEISTCNLNDPIIFQIESPQRFKIQLKDFTKNCPTNNAKINIKFNFTDCSIRTEEIYISI